VWHKNGVNVHPQRRRALPPLDEEQLQELALKYVGRFATSRAKLRAYLARKVRERGWDGRREPDFHALAERLARLGYIDDSAYALAKSRALTGRGYGRRRVDEKLRLAGIAEEDGRAARELAEREAQAAALRFAERRKIGPFAPETRDSKQREKAIGAMVRAGHSLSLARAIAALPPGAALDLDNLS
jgi:regulatory protein